MNISDKIILVTGGTGFIGKSLCDTLHENGARVVVLTRSPKRIESKRNISYISALSELRNVFPDIIINLAGEPVAQRWTAAAKNRI